MLIYPHEYIHASRRAADKHTNAVAKTGRRLMHSLAAPPAQHHGL